MKKSPLNYRYYYKRYLPHYQPLDSIFFITYRIKQFIPKYISDHLKQRKIEFEAKFTGATEKEYTRGKDKFAAEQFHYYDEQLAHLKNSDITLTQPGVAEIITSSLHFRHLTEYHLICDCIMPNHVHILIRPLMKQKETPFSLTRIMKNHKSITAKRANKYLKRSGPFWQPGFYDRCIRDVKEYENVVAYILNNPVKAGLIADWEQWEYKWISPEAF